MDLETIFREVMIGFWGANTDAPFNLVICGEPPAGVSVEELAQTVRMQFPKNPIFFITRNRKLFHREMAVHNGFTDAFFFPFDSGYMRRVMSDTLRKLTQGAVPSYRSILVADIRENSTLVTDLAVYLPPNSKFVPFLGRGSSITTEHFRKLTDHRVECVYVNSDQMAQFYEYARQGRMSFTERRHSLEDTIRPALRNIFKGGNVPPLEDGKKCIEVCKAAFQSYVLGLSKKDIPRQIAATMGDIGDNYDHALNTATYAALFGVVLGYPDPGNLAMAGLLHDIGEVEMPSENLGDVNNRLNLERVAPYSQHVTLSIDLIRELRLPIDREVFNAITDHHEAFKGPGFPNIAHGNMIPMEGQVLALADQFDYLTRHEEGQARMSTLEALAKVEKMLVSNDLRSQVSPIFVKTILNLFSAAKPVGIAAA